MFRLTTFGGVAIEGERGPISGRASLRRRLALLVLLAASRDRGVPRDKLLAFLWPERDAEHGRHSLSQLVHAIRRELGADSITVGVDDLRLNRSCIWTDVGAFEDAIAQGQLETAIALYAGPFLDGFFLSDAIEFERWAEEERARLAREYAAALESLAAEAARRGDSQSAVKLWRRRLATDPLNAAVTMALMRSLVDVGDRAGAIQQGRIHSALLQQELGVVPDTEIASLIERLRTETPARSATAVPSHGEAPSLTPSATAVEAPQRSPAYDRATPARLLRASLANDPRFLDAQDESLRQQPRSAWSTNLLRGRGRRVSALVLVLALVSAATFRTVQRAFGSARRAPRMIVVGSVRGTDKALSLAVGEAFRAELEAAPGLRVASEGRVREALHLMKAEPDTPIADSLAGSLAARLGAPFAVTATAEPLGLGAEIVVRLLDSRDGTAISTLSEHPSAAEEIVPAVTRLAEALRERALNIQVPDSLQALPAVTTASIAALRDYALARQSISHGDNERAISYAEAAVVEDSTFALAHYLLGDLLWYVDHQRHSDEHLQRAFALSDRLPPRERLIVRARYEQLVRDRLDSALAYWKLLRTTYPDEPRAYEGMAWVYTALGESAHADAAADTAFQIDPTVGNRGVRGHIARMIVGGDTIGALRFAQGRGRGVLFGTRQSLLIGRRDWAGVLHLLDSAAAYGVPSGQAAAWRQVPYLIFGRLADGDRALDEVRADPHVQYLPRALLLQARAEATEGSKSRASVLTREALDWVREADLSPPAYARYAERIADASLRSGDVATIAAVRHFIVAQDAGRNLRSYALSLLTIDACAALSRGDPRTAVSLLERTRGPMFYGRPVAITMQLEADALADLGNRQRADSLYRSIVDPRSQIVDGDGETFEIVRRSAARILAARN